MLLFTHFGSLSVQSQGLNPLLRMLVTAALEYDMVLQAVLALSGIHYLQGGQQSYFKATLEHQALALRSVKYAPTNFAKSETNLALPLTLCTLLFSLTEVYLFIPWAVVVEY